MTWFGRRYVYCGFKKRKQLICGHEKKFITDIITNRLDGISINVNMYKSALSDKRETDGGRTLILPKRKAV